MPAIFSTLRNLYFGRGLAPKPDPAIGSLLGGFEGAYLQQRAWRSFLFVGTEAVELVANRGNRPSQRVRTLIPYDRIGAIRWANDIIADLKILDHEGEEIARLVDTAPGSERAQELIEEHLAGRRGMGV